MSDKGGSSPRASMDGQSSSEAPAVVDAGAAGSHSRSRSSSASGSRRGSFASVKSTSSSQQARNASQGKVEEPELDKSKDDEPGSAGNGDGSVHDKDTSEPAADAGSGDQDEASSKLGSELKPADELETATNDTQDAANATEDSNEGDKAAVPAILSKSIEVPADAFVAAAAQETRPFSLAAPETPTATTSNLNAVRALEQADQSAQSAEWRDSTLDSVALSEGVPLSPASDSGSIVTRFQSVSFTEPEAGPSTPSTSHRFSAANGDQNPRRLSVRSEQAGSGHNYDLIAQHAQSLEAEKQDNPKRKRRSEMGSADLRASFAKLRDEAEHAKAAEEMSRRASASTETDETGQPINWDLWGEIMSDYEGMAKERPKELSKAIQNGIPPALRGMMWQLMSASKDPELEAVYSNLMKQPSPHEKMIIRDLNRTFPTHEYFHDGAGVGQGNLLNIMKAYSIYDEEVGYCQGMAFVVGPLLLNMPDEEAFCVLVRLMKSYDLRSQYVPDMPGLQLRLFQFDRLLEELVPAVFMHLLRQGIKSSMYASQWFLTLLAYRFPLELVCSVFDLIFAEGVEAIFRFALALMRKNENAILQMEFEQLLEFLKTGLFEHYKLDLQENAGTDGEPSYSAQTFVREALQVKITPIMLDQFAAEWTEMLRQQNAQSMEVEQLRTINKKLSAQVRSLEASLAQINQEHCELVKQVVSTRLEKEELEDELVRVKMALAQESLLREEGRGSIASRSSFASFGSYGMPKTPDNAPLDRRDSAASKASK